MHSIQNYFLLTMNCFSNMHLAAVDMCAPGRHECDQICVSNNGSYVCDCYEGYTLNPDKKTCSGKT